MSARRDWTSLGIWVLARSPGASPIYRHRRERDRREWERIPPSAEEKVFSADRLRGDRNLSPAEQGSSLTLDKWANGPRLRSHPNQITCMHSQKSATGRGKMAIQRLLLSRSKRLRKQDCATSARISRVTHA